MTGRRGHGEGDIHKRPDGRWEARLDFGFVLQDDGSKKRQRKSFYGKTRREVVAQLEEFKGSKTRTTSKATVAQWLDYWLESLIKPKREPTTYELYKRLARLYLKPVLGARRMVDLQPHHVDEWLESMAADKVGVRTRQSALQRLRTAINVFMSRNPGEITFNPAVPVEAPVQRTKKRPRPSVEEARRVLVAAEDAGVKAMVLTSLGVGFRLGETIGLQWRDLDLDARLASINRIVSRTDEHGIIVREKAKTEEGEEVVVLPQMVADALRELRDQQQSRARFKKEKWTDAHWVFPSNRGTVMDPRNCRRAIVNALKAAGISKTPQQLRRDFSGLILFAGVPPKVQQEMMRHTRYQVTAEKYQRAPDELQWVAVAKLDDLLGGTVSNG